MQVILMPTSEHAVNLVAYIISEKLREKPHLVIGLATGRTMIPLYKRLIEMHKNDGLDFSLAVTFNLDEYIGIPPDHPGSYHYYMYNNFFKHINIDPRNINIPNGCAIDIQTECKRYEEKIKDFGGIDLQILSIGESGHIGFNEPLSSMFSRTREKSLSPVTIEQNKHLFPNPEEMPKRAITMGVGTILEAEQCVVLVTGKHKSDIVAKAVEGPFTAMISATALQLHKNCTVVVDEEAGEKLTQKEYYKWIFENEPEWSKYRELLRRNILI
ncbi:MAG: glucosamine-6-phosphate deaminase [Candidatus Hydrogenedentes bacterium]|nr:glucosamine-6-phosphate deaminase [Candidatus Hydrogenedentota bacterium]